MAKFQFWLPKFTDLTRVQKRAVDETKPIFLSGVPGTGKTVVSIYRLKNSDNGILFTYGKLLKKTIEEKIDDEKYPVDNIHNWLWNQQGDNDNYKEWLAVMVDDKHRDDTVRMLRSQGVKFDEILVDEGQDLSINTYKMLNQLTDKLSISADNAQQINNKEEATNEEEIQHFFSNLRRFELDEIFRSAYELYKFAIQFVPNNARAHNATLLERLEQKNSGADKPLVYIEANLDGMFETVRNIIDDNPTDNIGILFEDTIDIETFAEELSNEYEISVYHSKVKVPDDLHNIILTTFKSAKGVEFDVVIIPYFKDRTRYTPEEYYVGVTRAKNQVHFLSISELPEMLKDFDEETYELIDNRS